MIKIQIPTLPDFAKVGGNARPGHYMQLARDIKDEKEKWIAHLIAIGYRQSDTPRWAGPVSLTVKMVFSTMSYPDSDSCWRSLKPLIDLLEPHRVIPKGRDPSSWVTRGFAGIVESDKLLELRGLSREVDRDIAPMTILHLEQLQSDDD